MRKAEKPDGLYALLMRVRAGGTIVSSAALPASEVAMARAEGRLFVDKDGFGYVYRPAEKKT